jgi:signal transduction histidine kinase
MLDRLEAASARQRAFVADAAHELRSPLAAIRTQVEVARAHPESAEWDATSEAVLEDVARLTRWSTTCCSWPASTTRPSRPACGVRRST